MAEKSTISIQLDRHSIALLKHEARKRHISLSRLISGLILPLVDNIKETKIAELKAVTSTQSGNIKP